MTAGTIHIVLLSHTNVGKTTLARTLLRKDIGAVIDRAHVTEVAEPHVAMRTATGDEMLLWDTPGFGDSARLLRRLEQSGQPIGWFLSQVWDRIADRPFWSSQQALRAARDQADVLLYVVNATEGPDSAGYAAPELQILRWLGKPALVLVNQLGTRADANHDAAIVRQWQAALEAQAPGVASQVLPFDAFARCWMQEHALLAAIAACIDPAQRMTYDRIVQAWRERDSGILRRSAIVLAEQLAELARDEEVVTQGPLIDKARRWIVQASGRGDGAGAGEQRARDALARRLDEAVKRSTSALVELHGLTGSAGEVLLRRMGGEFDTRRAADADRATLLGGIVTGALSGVAADLAAGGLTFGAGAVLGGVAGALGARKLTQLYNAERGASHDTVRWSDEFLDARLESAVIRYLAVAHFGRGRGEFQPAEPAEQWSYAIKAALQAAASQHARAWPALRSGDGDAMRRLCAMIEQVLLETLARLYPGAALHFKTRQ